MGQTVRRTQEVLCLKLGTTISSTTKTTTICQISLKKKAKTHSKQSRIRALHPGTQNTKDSNTETAKNRLKLQNQTAEKQQTETVQKNKALNPTN